MTKSMLPFISVLRTLIKGNIIISFADEIPRYSDKLTRAGRYLADMLEQQGHPVLTNFAFFNIVYRMYAQSEGQKLYLRHKTPSEEDALRLKATLRRNGFLGADRDYGSRILRVLSVSDLPAENIVCLVDPTCYVSHLSAMQRWGLTERNPSSLLLTRPDHKTAKEILRAYRNSQLAEEQPNPFPLPVLKHPGKVRRRTISLLESKNYGASLTSRRDNVRLSTIGQTFLDTLQKPELCGGMEHILEVWSNHASKYVDEIIVSVDDASSPLVKSRAGYILEERLGIKNPKIEAWKAFGQRGSSRKLDPSKEFAPTFSETWMISINV